TTSKIAATPKLGSGASLVPPFAGDQTETFVAPVTCTSAPGGMAGWWPGDGNTTDVIGHNDGTLQNGATFAAGKGDQGFSLYGHDDSVAVAQTIETNSEITLDAWINPSTLSLGWPVGPVVFEKGTDIFNRIGMQIKTDRSEERRVGKESKPRRTTVE